ncbi:oxidoreductase [Sandaracinus amylolyticus]|uniref:Putative oxidoreductase/Short-chain dehydrogenase n=1 Tax=Sandaracinus amylolyticus TaxID=927083 RepID=A0A0F6W1E3_9BACT|nr:oxidoreductase [Sandaracinus amylolyticus]AKF04961.1 putative oxidoreductase/Short-chain dehydrogenase [Sandaracinus amylolyticus]
MATTWTASNVPEQTGKTFVITGSNSGIGYEAAVILAQRGGEVILACRSQEKGRTALEQLRAAAPGAKVKLMKLDLASLASVRAFADQVKSEHGRIDALINNAGLMAIPRATTEDGFEMQLGTNHLGHFALTGLLFGRLIETAPARVVNVASQAHRMGKMRFEDLMGEKRYEKWSAYGQSKLANLLFTFELQRRTEKKWPGKAPVAAVACHPGYAATELQGKGPELEKSRFGAMIMKLGNGMFAQTAAMGALPTLRAATDPDTKSGDYYGPAGLGEMAGPPVKVGCTPAARDPEVAKQLWERSVELTKVDFGGL